MTTTTGPRPDPDAVKAWAAERKRRAERRAELSEREACGMLTADELAEFAEMAKDESLAAWAAGKGIA